MNVINANSIHKRLFIVLIYLFNLYNVKLFCLTEIYNITVCKYCFTYFKFIDNFPPTNAKDEQHATKIILRDIKIKHKILTNSHAAPLYIFCGISPLHHVCAVVCVAVC